MTAKHVTRFYKLACQTIMKTGLILSKPSQKGNTVSERFNLQRGHQTATEGSIVNRLSIHPFNHTCNTQIGPITLCDTFTFPGVVS